MTQQPDPMAQFKERLLNPREDDDSNAGDVACGCLVGAILFFAGFAIGAFVHGSWDSFLSVIL